MKLTESALESLLSESRNSVNYANSGFFLGAALLGATLADVLIDRERALQLLGAANLSNEVVATTLGCTPGYISQLIAEDAFREQVTALRTLTLTANSRRDRQIDSLEDRLIQKIEDTVDYIVKPSDALRAFAVINAAKRRGVQQHESTIIGNQVVNLVMPVQVVQQFVRNGMNEVVQVGERPLITIDSNQLLKDVALAHPDARKRAELETLAKSLPSSIKEALTVRDSAHDDGRMPSRKDYEQLGITRTA